MQKFYVSEDLGMMLVSMLTVHSSRPKVSETTTLTLQKPFDSWYRIPVVGMSFCAKGALVVGNEHMKYMVDQQVSRWY